MSSSAPPGLEGPDWPSWEWQLGLFARATGLVVTAYDQDGLRRIGPLATTKLGEALRGSSLWAEEGVGSVLERALAARCQVEERAVLDLFASEYRLAALPLVMHGKPRGAVLFGWVLGSFATGLGSERIAREIGISGRQLWSIARLTSPVTEAQMMVYVSLLQGMLASATGLYEAIGRLEELSRTRELLLAQVSHELRTPLSAISLRLHTLLEGRLDDPEHVRAQLHAMQSSVSEETRLIEDLIESATTRTGRFSLYREPAELCEVVRAAVAAVQPAADRKRVTIAVRGQDTLLPLSADARRLQQAFWNVLANAVKFTPAQGTVDVEITRRGADYVVEVRDTGLGIDAAALPHIFEPFARRQKGNATGLGLGLTIAKQIVEMHGGAISAGARTDTRGTVFTLTLPGP